MNRQRAEAWGLRILLSVGLASICALAGSGDPALAFALVWGPNGAFVVAFTRGALHLPRFLEPVHPIEPVLYRWLGVGFVKRIVTSRAWALLIGIDLQRKPMTRREFLEHAELSTKGAEVCHGWTFVLSLCVAIAFHAVGRTSMAVWIHVLNVALNGYPVMLQRANRWRLQQLQTSATRTPSHSGR